MTVGSSADAIPLPDASVDFMMLHCTFEHFEGTADTGFVRECARLLRPDGRIIILPLYLNSNFCNVTGEQNPETRHVNFDPEASYHCLIPEWSNRFGRHYSPTALIERVLTPAAQSGLEARLLRVSQWEKIDPKLWLRWILILHKPAI
jgi:SAM-dependent methyltransferase